MNFYQEIHSNVGLVYIVHPKTSDIPELISFLKNENLDLRRLDTTSTDSYVSPGKTHVFFQWEKFYGSHDLFTSDIEAQAKGILSFKNIPEKGIKITDAFRMKKIESEKSLTELQKTQLKNILILKSSNEIVSCVRVLPVDNDWELVSVMTKKGFRKKGLASLLVNKALELYTQRPLYSFQDVSLVPFYMHLYASENPTIPPFKRLPEGLQNDLFYMNIFWGPQVIIRIN